MHLPSWTLHTRIHGLDTTSPTSAAYVADVMGLNMFLKLLTKFINSLLIRYRCERLTPTRTIGITSKATKAVGVLSECIREVIYCVFVVELRTPSRQVDG